MSAKKIILFIIAHIIIFNVIWLMVNSVEENCWDKYPNNEVEAILNCEGK